MYDPEVDSGVVDQLRQWRRTSAHDITYYNRDTSLASRVCSGDSSLIYGSGQSELYSELRTYLGANGDGELASGARGPIMSVYAPRPHTGLLLTQCCRHSPRMPLHV